MDMLKNVVFKTPSSVIHNAAVLASSCYFQIVTLFNKYFSQSRPSIVICVCVRADYVYQFICVRLQPQILFSSVLMLSG